jgi:threonine/homoserine/homoserine lactone efflux protein
MPEVATLLAFSLAALVLFIIPGPAVLYIVARSVSQGRRAGLVSVAGIHVGSLVHIAAAVAGLSAILVRSAAAFTVIKLAGAAYLIWLGVRALRSSTGLVADDPELRSNRRVFTDGIVVNILNPKTAIFFLAFVPQFVNPNAGSSVRQLLILGALFVVIGAMSDGLYALAGARISRLIRSSPSANRRVARASGISYMGLGAWAAISR